jgi:hypothetical protein
MTLRVECRSESRADERPAALWLDGERVVVSEVLDRWLDAGVTRDEAVRRIFKLLLADERVLFIEQDEGTGAWALRPERWRPARPPEGGRT